MPFFGTIALGAPFGDTGNGPAYVYGPVYVVGYDIYGLDRDGDGVGCE